MNPAISVVCLCFNHEKYVGHAISSILSQSMTDFELVIIDDGSHDRSREIVQSFSDPRIRSLTQENRGPGYASSRAVAACRGKFIALMSADDACEPNRLEVQHKALAEGRADLHFCRPALMGDDEEPLPDEAWPIFFKRRFTTQEELFRILFFNGNFLCATSLMFRRDLVEQQGWVHTGLPQLQDFELWVRFAPYLRFVLSDDRLIRYRVRAKGGNLSSRKNKWRNAAEMRLIYDGFFDRVPRDFIRRSFVELQPGSDAESEADFQVRVAKLYLLHKNPHIRLIGIERLICLLKSREAYEEAYKTTGLTVREISALVEEAIGEGGINAGGDSAGTVSILDRLRHRFSRRRS
jgi:glycosyltransferase involved in cell wall biosynthesis